MVNVHFKDLGDIDYKSAWDYQEELLKKGLEIKSRKFKKDVDVSPVEESIDNYFLFCDHPHVYTLGKSGHIDNLLVNNEDLQKLNVSFFKTNRGGDITYHGPGQIVGYPILDLEQFETDLGKYMRNLEEVIIRTIAHYGIEGERLDGSTGVWLNSNEPAKARKICAMGVRCSRWITMHGFALNVNTDMSFFDHIVPCGITDKSVTSIQKELGREIDINEVKGLLKKEFEAVFNVKLEGAENLTSVA